MELFNKINGIAERFQWIRFRKLPLSARETNKSYTIKHQEERPTERIHPIKKPNAVRRKRKAAANSSLFTLHSSL
ncbi:MAG: hypothetical protein IKH22_08805 [Prevotella sp.]|nr:hypothetical protein [Prevotella sp.]